VDRARASPAELLRTKLVPPPPRPGALPRSALVDRLRAAATPGRLTLVVAGPGLGKSTLVGTWARAEEQAGARVAWFSVDATDDDPVRFWDYVVAGLAGLGRGAPDRSARLLAAPGTSTVDDVVPALVNELAALPEPVVLVVDDYHLVASQEVHHGVGLLLAQLPAPLRLVLVSRTAPPLPLDRLRGHGRLAEFGPDDLRLSPAETAELLAAESATTGTWTADEADRVHARTEGWVAGLHLAVLSRRTRQGAAPVAVRGDAAHLAGYLRAEVLDPLPPPVRAFLRRTALLDRFSAELAAAVSGQAAAAAMLARIEREQLFLVPLDDHREWYRYHHLFADVLRDDLAQAEGGLVPQLHTRAARWYAEHGHPVAAVPHALAGDDPTLAADLVSEHAPVLPRIGQVETALAWFRALGDDVCAADPRLATARALGGAHRGRPQDVVRWTAAAERALDDAGASASARGTRVAVATARWMAAVYAGDAGAALRAAEEAHWLLADGPGPVPTPVLVILGVARHRAGLLDASGRILAEAESVAEDRGEHLAVVSARGIRALQAVRQGRHDEAARLAASAEALAERHGLSEHFNTASFRAAQGWVALDDGRPGRAAELFHRALELVRRGGLTVEVAEMLTALATAEDRLGRHVAARRHVTEAARVLDGCPDPGHLAPDPRTAATGRGRGPDAAAPSELSDRQAEILRLLADGLTSAEIADRLRLSRRTVEAHLRTLYRKLGVRSRSAATRYAVEQGVVTAAATRPRTDWIACPAG
jgi:LuxR family transcriptional regulator, maltose regulon positive regulatory protein